MRAQCLTFEDIRDRIVEEGLGTDKYSLSLVQQDVDHVLKATAERAMQSGAQIIGESLLKLQLCEEPLWDKVANADLGAIGTILNIIEKRCKLTGAEKLANAGESAISATGAAAEELLRALVDLRGRRDAEPAPVGPDGAAEGGDPV